MRPRLRQIPRTIKLTCIKLSEGVHLLLLTFPSVSVSVSFWMSGSVYIPQGLSGCKRIASLNTGVAFALCEFKFLLCVSSSFCFADETVVQTLTDQIEDLTMGEDGNGMWEF